MSWIWKGSDTRGARDETGKVYSPIHSSPCVYTQSLSNENQQHERSAWEATYRRSRSCSRTLAGLTKAQGRQWERPWDRVAARQDTTVFRVREVRQNTGRQKEDLDGTDPSGTFSRIEAPPFLSHAGGDTAPANGGKQQGRD